MNKYLVIIADDSQGWIEISTKNFETIRECWLYIKNDMKNYVDSFFFMEIENEKDIECGSETIRWGDNGCFVVTSDFQCEYRIVNMEQEMKGE